MRYTTIILRTFSFAALASAFVGCALTATDGAASSPTVIDEQYTFDSPDEAALALANAASALDAEQLRLILGPDIGDISTGDPLTDDINLQQFAAAYDRQHTVRVLNDDAATLLVGEAEWPMPVPMVRESGRWHFDTPAGVEEIRVRRIGRNELATIDFLAVFVAAEEQRFANDTDGDGVKDFAMRISSSPGTRDGLYWPDADGAPVSPLGPLVAAAVEKRDLKRDVENQPYQGYRFRVLTRQGEAASGGARDYVDSAGRMTGGFAVIAWPAEYGETGIMSFLVSRDGIVYQRDLGATTAAAVETVLEFNPDSAWARPN